MKMTYAGNNINQSMRGNAGFTILEVLAALAIFSLGFMAIMVLQTQSIQGNARARGVTDVSVYAADRIEKLMALPFTDVNLVSGDYAPGQDVDGIDNNYDGWIDEANETGPLTVTWTIADDWPILNTKTITVTVTNTLPAVQRAFTVQNVKPEIL
jgi:prepilin-type N-terminal cleavage/methylation domain-containing protein